MNSKRVQSILNCIRMRKNIQVNKFSQILSSNSRLQRLKHKSINMCSTWQFLGGLFNLNKLKFTLCILFFVLSLTVTISAPFVINYIVHNLLDYSQNSPSLTALIIFILAFKLGGSMVSIVCDYLYSSLGFEYFAYMYWFILANYSNFNGGMGKLINILEYDCNIISNIVYSSLTSIFYSLELMVLFGLLTNYLIHTQHYSIFLFIVCGYVICQFGTNLAAFALNRAYIYQKDKRLDYNLNNQIGDMLWQRTKELQANRKFLLVKILSKTISILFPILINIYVFLLCDRNSIEQKEFTILILINLIRGPMGELMMAMNLNMEVLNSCRRIKEMVIGREMVMNSSLTDEIIGEHQCLLDVQGEQQRGKVDLGAILRIMVQIIKKPFLGCLGLIYIGVIVSRYYSNILTKKMIAQHFDYLDYLTLLTLIFAPILFYFLLMLGIQKVASTLFTKLKKDLSCQMLNRLSGDIAAVDRSVTINAFQIGYSFAAILGSYLFSIVSLGVGWLQALLVLFVGICIWIAFVSNRYVMDSRREVSRRELQLKSDILGGVLKGQTINTSPRLQKGWLGIFQCKQMGLLIQNVYMLLVSFLTLILSLVLIVLSEYLNLQSLTKSVLLMACLSIDRDIMMLFYALVRLQLSLVSFQRVLNVIKP